MKNDARTAPSSGRYYATGFGAILVLVFGLGGWSTLVEISGAVVAPGTVEVEGNRQVVQHPTGGVIEEILVRDGDAVEAGDTLVRLEGEPLLADLAVVEGQYFEVVARRNRLAAERDGLEEIAFDHEIVARAVTDAGLADLAAAQRQEFETQRRAEAEEVAVLQERRGQIALQIEGMAAQARAFGRQLELLSMEVANQERLFEQGLLRHSDLMAKQRELAEIEGEAGAIEAARAESRARMAEIEIEVLRIGTERRRAAIAELRELQFREIELRERRASLAAEVERLDLRAPVGGVIYGSQADTLRAVLRPADEAMFIVPRQAALVVRARIDPIHVDQVRVGQDAVLRFSAFTARTTPETEGQVQMVSADALQDERTGERFYRVDIRLDSGAAERLGGVTLLPGMPVEAFIRTDKRTPLSYLTKPLADYLERALREA